MVGQGRLIGRGSGTRRFWLTDASWNRAGLAGLHEHARPAGISGPSSVALGALRGARSRRSGRNPRIRSRAYLRSPRVMSIDQVLDRGSADLHQEWGLHIFGGHPRRLPRHPREPVWRLATARLASGRARARHRLRPRRDQRSRNLAVAGDEQVSSASHDSVAPICGTCLLISASSSCVQRARSSTSYRAPDGCSRDK